MNECCHHRATKPRCHLPTTPPPPSPARRSSQIKKGIDQQQNDRQIVMFRQCLRSGARSWMSLDCPAVRSQPSISEPAHADQAWTSSRAGRCGCCSTSPAGVPRELAGRRDDVNAPASQVHAIFREAAARLDTFPELCRNCLQLRMSG